MQPHRSYRSGFRLLGLMLALLLPSGAALAQVNILNGLVAHWSFEDNFEDSVGVFDGEERGSEPIAFVAGKSGFGKALKLNGEDQHVEITGGEPDDLAFAGGTVTVSVWFTVDTFDTSWQALVAKGEGDNWRIHRRGDELVMGFTGGGGGDTPSGTKAVNDGAWHHLVAISNPDTGTSTLYIDGVVDATRDIGALTANGIRMRIADNPGAPGREWEGMIDDVAIWNRALSAEEVGTLWAGGAGQSIDSFRGVRIESLGVGAEALIGGDLTDPENDGDEAAGPADPSWNWAGITSSHEPGFGGGEFAFNIFDNLVGGGNDKWCCDDPVPGAPVWVAVEFPGPVSLNRFTVTSGNDTPARDPIDWAIQGSNDGATYTDIYRYNSATAPWTARNEVLLFTLPAPAAPYRFIRYIAFNTPDPLHQINEIEYFGTRGAGAVAYISAIRNTITDFSFRVNDEGTSVVDPATVSLVLDGATINLGTLTKVQGVIDVVYTPPSVFPPNSVHTYSIRARDNFGNNIVSEGSFTTRAYALLTAADVVTPNTGQPGFVFNVHQNQAFQANDNTRPVQQLAGQLGPNLADPFAVTGATQDANGVPTTPGNLPIRFNIPGVLNLNQDGDGSAAGNIPDDFGIPGIPGIEGSTDGIAAQIDTYIELPAGITTMIFNSDDGFRTTGGLVNDVFRAQFAGQFVGGRGAADTAFEVYAATAGVYAFRTIWYEGGGGANLEWLTVKADGTKVLVNDTANGGLRAYRAVSGAASTVVSSVSPAPGANSVAPNANIQVIITEGTPAVDTATVTLTLDGAPVSATVTRSGSTITVAYDPPTDFVSPSTHTATLSFGSGATARSDTWTFSVPPITRDKTTGKFGFLIGAQHTADAGGRTGQPGDYAMDFGNAVGSVNVTDATFLNAPAGRDTLTFALWQKRTSVNNGSAFWANSPSSNNGTRGFQAHIPWSDSTIYFDTAGCCVADSQRINLNISEFPGYSGQPTWWNDWHHFVFVKNGGSKEIYIDGQLFHSGAGDPLPTDFTNMIIGGGPGTADNRMNGLLDDFAIYGTALTQAQITALAQGTAPGSITGNPGLIAHWDFNDPPAPPVASVRFTVTRSGNNVTVTSDPSPLPAGWVLQLGESITGPWVNQTGATTPVTVPIGAGNAFLRAVRP